MTAPNKEPSPFGAVKTEIHADRHFAGIPGIGAPREYTTTLVMIAPVDELLLILEACSGRPLRAP